MRPASPGSPYAPPFGRAPHPPHRADCFLFSFLGVSHASLDFYPFSSFSRVFRQLFPPTSFPLPKMTSQGAQCPLLLPFFRPPRPPTFLPVLSPYLPPSSPFSRTSRKLLPTPRVCSFFADVPISPLFPPRLLCRPSVSHTL